MKDLILFDSMIKKLCINTIITHDLKLPGIENIYNHLSVSDKAYVDKKANLLYKQVTEHLSDTQNIKELIAAIHKNINYV